MADKGGYQILKDIYDEFGIEYTEWDLGVDNADHNHPVHRYNRGRFNAKDVYNWVMDESPLYSNWRTLTQDRHHEYWDGIEPKVWKDDDTDEYDAEPDRRYLPALHTFQAAIDHGFSLDDYERFNENIEEFIDDMWGYTPHDEDSEATPDPVEGAIGAGEDRDWWGLDIKWNMKDIETGEDVTKDHPQYMEYLTGRIWKTKEEAWEKGVNHEYYQDGEPQDNKFVWAHGQIAKEGDEKIDTFEEIREANKLVFQDILEEAKRGEAFDPLKGWEGQYKKKYDANDPSTYPEIASKELDVYKDYTPAPLANIHIKKGPVGGIKMPSSLKNIKKVPIKVPGNLPVGGSTN